MTITNASVYEVCEESVYPVKAVCSITFDNSVKVFGIKVIEGKDGLFVAMPNTGDVHYTELGKRRYVDIVKPLTKGMYNKISDAILDAYQKSIN